MYIKDGSNKDYVSDGRSYLYLAHDIYMGKTEEQIIDASRRGGGIPAYPNAFTWGWLEDKVETSGWDAEEKRKVLNKLQHEIFNDNEENYCLDRCCGYHSCGVCNAEGVSRYEAGTFNGSMKIEHNGKVYISPWGVDHYIEKHDYRPSDEVIDAILNGHYLTEEEQTHKCFEYHSDEIYARAIEIKEEIEEREREFAKRKAEVQTPEFKTRLERLMANTLEPFSPEEEEEKANEIISYFAKNRKIIDDMADYFKRMMPCTTISDEMLKEYLLEQEKMEETHELRKLDRDKFKEDHPVESTPEHALKPRTQEESEALRMAINMFRNNEEQDNGRMDESGTSEG